jgi:DNA topoisomerase-6 subunit B
MRSKSRAIRQDAGQASLFADPEPTRASRELSAAALGAAPATREPKRVPRAEKERVREDAGTMAARQREIPISEFFTKNRHLLGFDNPQKALLTAIKEAVDNSLDACEEAGILPELTIEIVELAENRYRISVEDNGPGIVRQQIPKIFGKLLYGSKFHRLKQQRGQQGIGISAAGMYGQLTTGRPVRIVSRTAPRAPAHLFEIAIDTQKNAPVVQRDSVVSGSARMERGSRSSWTPSTRRAEGRSTTTWSDGAREPARRGRYGAPREDPRVFERTSRPAEGGAGDQAAPYGVGGRHPDPDDETDRGAACGARDDRLLEDRPDGRRRDPPHGRPEGGSAPKNLTAGQVELLFKAIPKVKIMAPPTACLSPIGEELLSKGLGERTPADFATAVSRPPAVYRGNPFQVEVALAYGGKLPAEEPADLYRLANRVPLQYQQSACAITRAVLSIDWRSYGLQQARGALPVGPLVIMVHIASVWVPFTSESRRRSRRSRDRQELAWGCRRRAASRAFVRHRRRAADGRRRVVHRVPSPHRGRSATDPGRPIRRAETEEPRDDPGADRRSS